MDQAVQSVAAGNPIDDLTELSVLAPDKRLRPHYARFVLISHCNHLDSLDVGDTDTLVVTSDWLTWRKWVDGGGHGVHFEAAIAEWPSDAESAADLYLRSARWMFDDAGNDLTLFHGVSLGKQFLQDVSLFSKAIERLRLGLDRLISAYRPDELRLIDVQTENRLLDDPMKRRVIADLADQHSIKFVDALTVPDDADPLWPDPRHTGVEPTETGLRARLRSVYSMGIDFLFRVTTPHFRHRPRVFLLTNWNAVSSIVDAFDDKRLVLVLIAANSPKNISFLWRCWRRGIFLAHLGGGGLSGPDERALDEIHHNVERAWKENDADLMENYRRAFVQERIFGGGWPRRRAPMVKKFNRLWRRDRFHRAVVGDAGNALNRMIAETAAQWDVPVDEIPNGMYLSDQRLDARTGHADAPPLIQRILAWGPQQEDWVRATKAPIETVRIGYPAIDSIRCETETAAALNPDNAILVLGAWVDGYDAWGLHSIKPSYTIDVVRALQGAGFHNIRVKIHPGTPNLSYYQEAFRHCRLTCELIKEGPVTPHVDWADAVIGPVSSGSLVETLATGTPYFALRHFPSLMSRQYCDRLQAFDTPKALVDALVNGWRPDREEILSYVCAFREIPNASRRFWQVIAASVGTDSYTGEKLQRLPA